MSDSPPLCIRHRAQSSFVAGKQVFASILVPRTQRDRCADRRGGQMMTLGVAADEIDEDGLARAIEDHLRNALGPEP